MKQLLVLVLTLVLPFAARAANEGEIHNYIISIKHLYENLDFELALNRIQLGRQLPRSTDDEVTLSLYEGLIRCEMGKQKQGVSIFRSALLLRPDTKLPVQVAPKLETLFESVRKQVKQELASRLPPSEPEKHSNRTELEREEPSAPPATGPAQEKREDTGLAQTPKKEEPLTVAPRASTAQVPKEPVKVAPTPPAPSSAKAEQKEEEPVAVQPLKTQGCGPMPASASSQSQKDQQLWRLASMQRALCLSGKFQGVVAERLTELKLRMEEVTTSYERTLVTKDIDQFASEFIYEDPRWKVERTEAERLKAEQLERLEAERLEAKRRNEERLEAE